MKTKLYAVLAIFVGMQFVLSYSASAQEEYTSKKFGVKVGYFSPSYKEYSESVGGAFGYNFKDSLKGGFSLGFEGYLASTPKSEVVIGLEYARITENATLTYDSNGNGTLDSVTSDNPSGNWLHIPLTYKFKFSQSETGTGPYIGPGISYFKMAGSDQGTNSFNTFGYHVKGGYDFGKGAFEIEWSSGKKRIPLGGLGNQPSVEMGGLTIFGIYKF